MYSFLKDGGLFLADFKVVYEKMMERGNSELTVPQWNQSVAVETESLDDQKSIFQQIGILNKQPYLKK